MNAGVQAHPKGDESEGRGQPLSLRVVRRGPAPTARATRAKPRAALSLRVVRRGPAPTARDDESEAEGSPEPQGGAKRARADPDPFDIVELSGDSGDSEDDDSVGRGAMARSRLLSWPLQASVPLCLWEKTIAPT
jgi:hypothetical protein